MSSYSYDFDWRLLFFYGEEFYSLDELPESLLAIRNGFPELNLEIETALTNLAKKNTTGKEAA